MQRFEIIDSFETNGLKIQIYGCIIPDIYVERFKAEEVFTFYIYHSKTIKL